MLAEYLTLLCITKQIYLLGFPQNKGEIHPEGILKQIEAFKIHCVHVLNFTHYAPLPKFKNLKYLPFAEIRIKLKL